MVNYTAEAARLDDVFQALADGTRRGMVERLAHEGPRRVTDLAAPLAISLPAVSKHLKVLERAGLVRRRKDGREHEIALETEPLSKAVAWLDRHRRFWQQSFDRLESFLARDGGAAAQSGPSRPEPKKPKPPQKKRQQPKGTTS